MEGGPYKLDKWVWTEADFDRMGWHDVAIHAMAPILEAPDRAEFVLDLDYILKWVNGLRKGGGISFWVSPATLVFKAANDLRVHLEGLSHEPCWVIYGIDRDEQPSPRGDPGWRWTLALQEGEVSLRATGYKQYIRREPVLNHLGYLKQEERGGISFARESDLGRA